MSEDLFVPKMPTKKKMTDEERAALSKKLDDELDQFMEEMAARKASEPSEKKPFDFQQWCKEIDQHPAFMKDLTTAENGEYSETVQALQALKYETGDTAEEKQWNAEKFKLDGNKHFQLKKYRWASDCYSNGIKEKCLDKKLNGVLYCNRAAAQKHIGNLRSAIKDCTMGRRFDPTNLKGVVRGAECLLELGYGRDAIEWIESSKLTFAFYKETEEKGVVTKDETKQLDLLEELRKKAVEAGVLEERNKRKSRAEERKEVEKKKRLMDALKERKMNLRPRLPFDRPELFEPAFLQVSLPQLDKHHMVQFDDDGNLVWPLLVQYPQVGQIDILTDVCETTVMGELLREVLASQASWDTKHEFKYDNVRFFVADEYDEYLLELFDWNEFKFIFSLPGYQVRYGLPVIMAYTRDKVAEKFMRVSEDSNKYIVK